MGYARIAANFCRLSPSYRRNFRLLLLDPTNIFQAFFWPSKFEFPAVLDAITDIPKAESFAGWLGKD